MAKEQTDNVNSSISNYYNLVYNFFCGGNIQEDELLNVNIPMPPKNQTKTIYVHQHDNRIKKYNEIADKINSLFKKGRELEIVDNIIVHGSYGDYTANNYSDVDLTIMFRSEVFYHEYLLIKARKFILQDVIPFTLRIDPFQHHGPFILWPELLQKYEQSILPIEVYEYAWAANDAKYEFCISESVVNKEKFFLTCDNLFRLGAMSLGTKDLFLIKRFLSNLMLLPAFFLMAQGRCCHKSVSFVIVEKEIRNFESLDIASKIRSEWPSLSYYRILSMLVTPLFKYKTLLSAVILGQMSRLFPHNFCMDDIRKVCADLGPMCSDMKRRVNNV